MKTLEEMIAVMQAALDGKPIEHSYLCSANYWTTIGNPIWNWVNFDYRVAVTKPSVDWSVLTKEVVAIATDWSGRSWAYTDVPKIIGTCWAGAGTFGVDHLASFVPGTCDWRDSLIIRPEGV